MPGKERRKITDYQLWSGALFVVVVRPAWRNG